MAKLGCGSGVLAIAATKLGFAPVTALDHDGETRNGTNLSGKGIEGGVRQTFNIGVGLASLVMAVSALVCNLAPGTLIGIFPVTDETVVQTSLTMKEEPFIKMETNKEVLPKEGTDVTLVIEVK